jgi:hypothetical protein
MGIKKLFTLPLKLDLKEVSRKEALQIRRNLLLVRYVPPALNKKP